jgi:hypothetical protein
MSDDVLVIHSSLRGWISAAISPTALLLLGGAAASGAGFRPVPVALLLGGAVLAIVVAADLPRHTRFTEDGVVRVCLLRMHRLAWTQLVAIERTRPNTMNLVRNLAEQDRDQRQVSGGLIARGTGRRRWLLTDNLESRSEHDELARLLERHDIPVPLRAPRPHADAPPTDLYRRRRDR